MVIDMQQQRLQLLIEHRSSRRLCHGRAVGGVLAGCGRRVGGLWEACWWAVGGVLVGCGRRIGGLWEAYNIIATII